MERIEGLSIGLSLDSLKVESGLKNLNRQFSLVNSEMRNNMSAFGKSERSISKYETRLDGLNKKLDVQKTRVESAYKTYEKMVEVHGEGSAEAEKAAIEYNKQSASLKNLESDISRTTAEMKKFAEAQRIENSGWTKLGNAMDVAGTKLQDFGHGVKDLGGKMTLWLTAPIVALGGTAIAKGLSRLIGIDTAKAKLDGLGHSAENVEKIMGSALDAVRGTSFGLDEAATTAANAVAAGVKEGKSLTKYLSLTGDAAAIAGTSLAEMGGIFNKVQTSGKAYNGELRQLSDRGLPIYQWLAKEADATADAVFNMASDGEISTKMFLKAIENNIGGAAQIMGEKSFTAALANMWAAVGRLGANFLDAGGEGGGFFSTMKPLISDMTAGIDKMSDVAQEWGVKFGQAFGKIVEHVKTAITWFQSLSSQNQKLIGSMAGLTIAAGPILTVLGTLIIIFGKVVSAMAPVMHFIAKKGGLLKTLRLGFVALTGPVGLTIAAITALVAGFAIAYKKSDSFREVVHKVKDAFVQTYQKVKEFLTTNPKFLAFLDSIKQGFFVVKDFIVDTFNVLVQRTKEFLTSNKFLSFLESVKQGFFTAKNFIVDTFNTLVQKTREFLSSNKFLSFVDSVKEGFFIVKGLAIQAFGAAMDFVKEKISEVKSFWDSDGQKLMQAFKNIFNGIKAVVTPVMSGIFTAVKATFNGIRTVAVPIIDGLVAAFKWAFPYMQTILSGAFQVILIVVKMVWQNIKGVIDGGLKVIMGLVKVFSGLFTGDFSKMWEGIKQVFVGAIQFVWNFVQLTFFGRILRGGVAFIRSFAGFFTSMWAGIRTTFNNVITWIVNFVRNRFTSMQNTVSSITTAIRNTLSRIWNFIWNGIIMPVVRGIVDFTRARFSAMRDLISNIFTRVRDITRNMWNSIRDRIINPVRDAVNGIRARFNDMKNRISGIFNDVKTNIQGYVRDMVDTVKGMPQRMSDGLKQTASKVGDGLKAVANKMTEMLGKGVNGVIGGVNWVLDKVGVSSRISEWAVPVYAHGTEGHPGGPAIVGDGKGRNSGKELIQTPDGKQYLSPSTDTLVDLPKGTHVWSALETKEMLKAPRYFLGTLKDAGKGLWNTTKNVGRKIKDTALDVWDYVSNPGKLFDKALEMFGVETPEMGGILKNVGTGAFNKAKDELKKFVANKITGFFGGEGGGVGWKGFRLSSPFNPARRHPITGRIQPHNGDDWAAPMGTPFVAQAPGKVTFAGRMGGYGNLIKIQSGAFERRYAHNQRNLVSVGQAVKAGQTIGLTGSTGDSTGPHVHYEVRRNGVPMNPRGFASGTNGPLSKAEWAWVGEEGPELMRLNKGTEIFSNKQSKDIVSGKSRPIATEAMKLLAIVGKKLINRGSTSENQTNSRNEQDDSTLKELVAVTQEQNRILTDTNNKLLTMMQKLLDKGTKVYMGQREVGSQMDSEQSKRMAYHERGLAY